MRPLPVSHAPAGDRRRLFVTALLVYALFANPVLAGAVVFGAVAAAIHRVWRREAATAQPALA